MIDTKAVVDTGDEPDVITYSDKELIVAVKSAKKNLLMLIIWKKNKPGGGYFKYLNNTMFDFIKYGIFNDVVSEHYNAGVNQARTKIRSHIVRDLILASACLYFYRK